MVKPLRRRGRQAGAALLLALLIMTLVATLAASMVWLQWRGIEVEAAERARAQAEWLLNASLDWGNLILKSSIRNNYQDDDLGQPWATPLAETKLSSFLSADGNHDAEGGPEAYLSGQISDAESKYNLYNLVVPAAVPAGGAVNAKFDEINRFKILCTAIGIAPDIATTLGSGLRNSWDAQQAASSGGQAGDSVLMPVQLEDLAWYGIDPKVLKQLQPFVQLLPPANGEVPAITNINLNTAPAEVLMAAVPGLTRAQAQQMILSRQTHPFISLAAAWTSYGVGAVGPKIPDGDPPLQAAFKSQHFEIYGQLRLEQHVVRERSVVYRKDQFAPIQVLRRERIPPDAT
ncbi:MAG: type II secretion system minor pseudopilin GspK [Caulobacter sp.]|nr:type II secretion system minor pseudopilin GspK [Vitreoscilla sp.]